MFNIGDKVKHKASSEIGIINGLHYSYIGNFEQVDVYDISSGFGKEQLRVAGILLEKIEIENLSNGVR